MEIRIQAYDFVVNSVDGFMTFNSPVGLLDDIGFSPDKEYVIKVRSLPLETEQKTPKGKIPGISFPETEWAYYLFNTSTLNWTFTGPN